MTNDWTRDAERAEALRDARRDGRPSGGIAADLLEWDYDPRKDPNSGVTRFSYEEDDYEGMREAHGRGEAARELEEEEEELRNRMANNTEGWYNRKPDYGYAAGAPTPPYEEDVEEAAMREGMQMYSYTGGDIWFTLGMFMVMARAATDTFDNILERFDMLEEKLSALTELVLVIEEDTAG